MSAASSLVGDAHDEADLLYATQLSFDRQGEPVITVGVLQGAGAVTVEAAAGLVVRLSGPARSAVTLGPGHALRARVADGVAGRTRYRVVLDTVGGGNLSALTEARRRWGDRGLALEEIELGGIVGFPGRVLDNRRTLVVERGFHERREDARARADAVATEWHLAEPPGLYADPQTRSKGRIVLEDRASGLAIAQDRMLTVVALDGGPVAVQPAAAPGAAPAAVQRYHGEIVVALDADARITVVNRVSAEVLLAGLVPSEIFPSAPAAALEAQAITARGELFAKVGVRHLADPFLVCATQHCQVYRGTAREDARTTAAVRATRGQMLFDAGGHLVDSVYSASCGGHTEHNEHVWEGVPRDTLRGRADAAERAVPWPAGTTPDDEALRRFLIAPPASYCQRSMGGRGAKAFRWERTLPDAELDRLVNGRHPVGHVRELAVGARGVSGRARAITIRGERSAVTVSGELVIRRLLGNLRSAMFVVDHADGTWRFSGGGWGHGVGLCQYGAIGMAEQGLGATKILGHYYGPGVKVEKLY